MEVKVFSPDVVLQVCVRVVGLHLVPRVFLGENSVPPEGVFKYISFYIS